MEAYLTLLARLGRYSEALQAGMEMLPPEGMSAGTAPTLLELAEKSGGYARLLEHLKERGDLLSYAAALIEQS